MHPDGDRNPRQQRKFRALGCGIACIVLTMLNGVEASASLSSRLRCLFAGIRSGEPEPECNDWYE